MLILQLELVEHNRITKLGSIELIGLLPKLTVSKLARPRNDRRSIEINLLLERFKKVNFFRLENMDVSIWVKLFEFKKSLFKFINESKVPCSRLLN